MAEEMKIAICGCGPGSIEDLTPRVRRAAESAEVLVGAQRLLDLFPDSRAERVAVTSDIEAALAKIAAAHGRRVVVLVTGDPGLRSFAQPVLRRFGRSACEVIPGISSVQVAFARLGLDWTDARIVNAHGADPKTFPALEREDKVAVLAGRPEAWRWIAVLAAKAGATGATGADFRAFVCENLTLENERVREVALGDLAAEPAASLSIVVLVRKGLLE